MNETQLAGIIRHVITTLGGFLVAFGWIGEEIVSQSMEAVLMLVGGVFAVLGVIHSFKSKEKQGVK